MKWFKSGDLLDRAFAVGIIVKGLDPVLEVVGGILLLTVSPTTIDKLTTSYPSAERLRREWLSETQSPDAGNL